jgi:hypothetical protein
VLLLPHCTWLARLLLDVYSSFLPACLSAACLPARIYACHMPALRRTVLQG